MARKTLFGQLLSGDVVSIGDRTFWAVGKPKFIGNDPGQRKGLAGFEWFPGKARELAIVVGQNKGKEPKNQKGVCARAPSKFSTRAVDAAFTDLRETQVGRQNMGATRASNRGWFRGDREPSVTYRVVFIPNDAEKTFAQFEKNMVKVAERLAEKFCQDSVIVQADDGREKKAGYAWWKPKGRR